MSTCRFCKDSEGSMVKYGVRHYAHAKCALEAKGAEFFQLLTPWQATQFPYLAAHKAGLADALKARCAEYVE